VLARGHIFIASQQGVLSVVSAKGDWETLTSHDFGEGIYATPVFADNRMYLRTEVSLYCFEN
jgi:hypothetical protein